MNWLSVVWLASFVMVADVASGCSDGSAGASGPISVSCGHLAGSCCAGGICASGLACQNALCTLVEAVDGGPASGNGLGDGTAALDPAGCVPVPSGLVSWWKGDGDASDSVGPNSGTRTGAVTYVGGMVGQAFHFASDSYVSASTIGTPTGGSDRTIEAWVRFESQYAGGDPGALFRIRHVGKRQPKRRTLGQRKRDLGRRPHVQSVGRRSGGAGAVATGHLVPFRDGPFRNDHPRLRQRSPRFNGHASRGHARGNQCVSGG